MPVTISYDLVVTDGNQRTYVRSMLERFGWIRLGGSVFRYEGREANGRQQEDWLNDVIPALMFMRSYLLRNNATFRFFTLDAASVSRLDHSDPAEPYGNQPHTGADLSLVAPSNPQSSDATIRSFVDTATAAT